MAKEKEKNVGMAIIAYVLFFVPLLTDAKDDPFVKFHVKQSIVLVVAWVANFVVAMIPVLGWIAAPIISLVLLILWILGVVNAANGEKKYLPIIGEYGDKIKI